MKLFAATALAVLITTSAAFVAWSSDTEVTTAKSTIASSVENFLSNKAKKFSSDPDRFDGNLVRYCKSADALSCQKHRLSSSKRNKFAPKVMTIFGEGCEQAGGTYHLNGKFPTHDGVDAYFSEQRINFKNSYFTHRDIFVGCYMESKPEIFLRVVSLEPVAPSNTSATSLLGSGKSDLYFAVIDGDKIAGAIEKARLKIVADKLAGSQSKSDYETCMAKPLQVGDNSRDGLIIEIKGPVAQIQGRNDIKWVKTESLTRAHSEC